MENDPHLLRKNSFCETVRYAKYGKYACLHSSLTLRGGFAEIKEEANSQESMTSSENSSDQKLPMAVDSKTEGSAADNTDQRAEQTTDAEVEVRWDSVCVLRDMRCERGDVFLKRK